MCISSVYLNVVCTSTEVAESCFDRCMSYGQEKNPEHRDHEITFYYEFLDDTYMPWMDEDYRKRLRGDDTSSLSETTSVGKRVRRKKLLQNQGSQSCSLINLWNFSLFFSFFCFVFLFCIIM